MQKVTKKELIDHVAAEVGSTKALAMKNFEAVINAVVTNLKSGKAFSIPDVGTICIKETKERTVRVPSTGQMVTTPAGKRFKLRGRKLA